MAVIGHPQRLATLLTTLFQRGQRLLMRRFQARGSSSHTPSPVGLLSLLLLSGYTPCQVFFAIQPFPKDGKLGLIKALDACLFEVLSVIRMNRVEPGSTESVRGSLAGKSTLGRTLFAHEAIGGR